MVRSDTYANLISALGQRSFVLVGMMGAGKSAVGRALAKKIGLPFVDSDAEIVVQGGMPIPDYFKKYGEADFRKGERRVIASLLRKARWSSPPEAAHFAIRLLKKVIRASGVTIWLKEDPKILWDRLRGRTGRPMLASPNPEDAFHQIFVDREPRYAMADITIELHNRQRDKIVREILDVAGKLAFDVTAESAT